MIQRIPTPERSKFVKTSLVHAHFMHAICTNDCGTAKGREATYIVFQIEILPTDL